MRWSQSLGCWYVPRPRLAEALRAAGFEVDVLVDEAPRPVAEVETDRAARAEYRRERLKGTADREAARAAGHDRAAHVVLDGIPLGQPILVGHHSERQPSPRVAPTTRVPSAAVWVTDSAPASTGHQHTTAVVSTSTSEPEHPTGQRAPSPRPAVDVSDHRHHRPSTSW